MKREARLLSVVLVAFAAGCGSAGSDGAQTVGSSGEIAAQIEPAILSAYLGITDAVALAAAGLAAVSGCPQEPGDEGMPVIFNLPVAGESLDPEDFTVTTHSGAEYRPGCAVLAPADEPDELQTVLLTGQMGTTEDPPASVTISAELFSAGGVSLLGLESPPVTDVENGAGLVYAYLDPAGSACSELGSESELQLAFQGGITAEFGAEFSDANLTGFSIIDSVGTKLEPAGFDDLGDGDNHLVLCVPAGVEPQKVEVAPGVVFDPLNHPNSGSTSSAVAPRP